MSTMNIKPQFLSPLMLAAVRMSAMTLSYSSATQPRTMQSVRDEEKLRASPPISAMLQTSATTLNQDRYIFCMSSISDDLPKPLHRRFVHRHLCNVSKIIALDASQYCLGVANIFLTLAPRLSLYTTPHSALYGTPRTLQPDIVVSPSAYGCAIAYPTRFLAYYLPYLTSGVLPIDAD